MERAKRVEVTVAGKVLHLVLGMLYSEWAMVYDDKEDVWDFDLVDLLDGTIEIDEDIWYWYIKGRVYETNEEV